MTSCTYGFYKNGKYKVAYNNADSYPEYFGKEIVAFIRENTLEELNELADKIKLVKRHAMPTDKEYADIEKSNMYIEKNFTWDSLYFENCGFFDYYINGYLFMPDYSDWMGHQDWSYIINLDENLFQIYKFKNEFIREYDLNKIPKDWYIDLE